MKRSTALILAATALVVIAAAAGAAYLVARNTQPDVIVVQSQPPGSPTQVLATNPTMTAKLVLEALTAAGLPITNPAVQDETTDPNNMIGRPGGYLSRASFDTPGGNPEAEQFTVDRGGVIEVFADAATAKARSAYIQQLTQANPVLGREYNYLSGPVLVRVTGGVVPSQASRFEAAVGKLPAG